MEAQWFPFINRTESTRPSLNLPAWRPQPNTPWGLYLVYLLIVLGVGCYLAPWQRITGRAQIAELQSQLEAAQQHIASLETPTRPPPTTQSLPPVPSTANLSAEDRDIKLDVWNTINNDCLDNFRTAWDNYLANIFRSWVTRVQNKGIVDILTNAQNQIITGTECLAKIRHRYSKYNDIVQVIVEPYTVLTEKAIDDFVHAVNDLPEPVPEDYEVRLRQYAGHLHVQATHLQNWMTDVSRIANQQISELSGRK